MVTVVNLIKLTTLPVPVWYYWLNYGMCQFLCKIVWMLGLSQLAVSHKVSICRYLQRSNTCIMATKCLKTLDFLSLLKLLMASLIKRLNTVVHVLRLGVDNNDKKLCLLFSDLLTQRASLILTLSNTVTIINV